MKKYEVKKENFRTTNFGFVIPVGEALSEGIFDNLDEAKSYINSHVEEKIINLRDLSERYYKFHIYELEAEKEENFDTSNLGLSDLSDDKKEIWLDSSRNTILTKTLIETIDKNHD
ncbi:hypothetical protein [Oceanivirga miroungae]|uniref:Uncharacterized protein n=1 Tax=Oceanivirga miroungae TaxID=1130046 RepID=A0A6I8MB11_9FUSO|nr:hypothetical protein [Oceanivirga miroungae]VWL85383.1 hypothetical protein OMES3154_00668 [Oceanivirga miroungae]